jgi:flagellar biosynthesis/type III secretory pathway protein FliH
MLDRIEALTAERDMATEGWAEATRLIELARQQYGAEKSRAEAAEAKLAKAVQTAYEEGFLAGTEDGWVNNPRIEVEWKRSKARATLAEIEGEKT